MNNSVLLINPALHEHSQNRLLTKIVIKTLPLGIGYLAAYLLENGFGATIVDEQIDHISDELLKKLLDDIDGEVIVGFTCYTLHVHRIKELSKKIKEYKPDSTIVIGGVHSTVVPEETLNSMPYVDIAVRGEGEITFFELVSAITTGDSIKHIAGISFKKNGQIVHNQARPLVKDIDSLPSFPYHLFEKNHVAYMNFGSLITSRGCPYDCIFCSQRSMTGSSFRFSSNKRVVEVIELLATKYKQKNILFLDDMILANPLRFVRLVDAIIEKGLHKQVSFNMQVRGDSINEKMAKKIKEANFVTVFVGMETGSQRIMDLIDKKEQVTDNINAVKLLHAERISVGATFIFGFPTETEEERDVSIELALSLPLESARFNIATPYPGTRLHTMAVEQNRLQIEDDYSNFNVQYYMMGDEIPYYPLGVNKYKLMFKTAMANMRFHMRWHVIIAMLSSPTCGGNVLNLGDKWIYNLSNYFFYLRLAFFIGKRLSYLGLRAALSGK